ncbi:protein atonal homolog 8 isoform X2 [Silurus meridionalis]|uniref:protein atonal homolog 8 isoform X2 n=1 Tax=Silurus meridionalis TaxID=175797 RepID=UPI001EEC9324|nr:protein atonal homolog 8 isoform X2 [Silurus meridionalis]
MKKNPVNMDRCNPTDGYKKYKRKVRDSVKHGEKLSPHSKTSIDSMGPLLKEVCGKTRDKKLEHFDTAEDYRQQPDILNTALDMKMYTLPSQITNETETPLWSVSETAFKSRNDSASLQVSVFNNQQAIPTNCHPQSRILLCKRSERALCSTSLGSYLHNSLDHTDSLRKRSEEQTVGVVTEIKAIQQTRRLLANARERTRVHTISAAFEALRKQVPCYSYGQKLSKLAILRIACNYILSLAQLVDLDYTPDHSNMSFRECVQQCTRTLQAEGRSKKRKPAWSQCMQMLMLMMPVVSRIQTMVCEIF